MKNMTTSSSKTIKFTVNEPALKAWTFGYVSCEPNFEYNKKHPDQKWFDLVLTQEQYEAYPGSVYDPWID